MRSELENALMGLLALHPKASGYELHRVVEESTGYMLSASFSQIYPALKKLAKDGLVSFEVEPIKNRPGKKRYELTEAGKEQLQQWLISPVDYGKGFNPFDLRIAFAPLMEKDDLIQLVDSGISELESQLSDPRAGGRDPRSYGFVDESAVDMAKLDFVWQASVQRFRDERTVRLDWLREFREGVRQRF